MSVADKLASLGRPQLEALFEKSLDRCKAAETQSAEAIGNVRKIVSETATVEQQRSALDEQIADVERATEGIEVVTIPEFEIPPIVPEQESVDEDVEDEDFDEEELHDHGGIHVHAEVGAELGRVGGDDGPEPEDSSSDSGAEPAQEDSEEEEEECVDASDGSEYAVTK